ncbi:Na+/H+ antiporter subunit G [Corynebacterium poyangense]|uniref:Na+/H+ antiporter subunit G n=1 Tax=Corynebacterium poyangense TaxID=2684405 RepID=A0A7H0SLK7_9CORY|nr:Na+/H+ antiporter subunit G [Corynebacterium poyangense]MBZ8177531.1 Na+/H+ antiporter subunit G [Corynebacterium poyangense]QNQ89432.1 Na+/H+ antiporter subunit G [Corynebacterium poyangense]
MAGYEVLIAALAIIATLLVVTTCALLWRAPDALTRVNVLGPTTSLAIPALLIAKLIRDFNLHGFDASHLIRALIAVAGVWVICAVGSFYIARSIHGVTIVDPGSDPMSLQEKELEGEDESPEHHA